MLTHLLGFQAQRYPGEAKIRGDPQRLTVFFHAVDLVDVEVTENVGTVLFEELMSRAGAVTILANVSVR